MGVKYLNGHGCATFVHFIAEDFWNSYRLFSQRPPFSAFNLMVQQMLEKWKRSYFLWCTSNLVVRIVKYMSAINSWQSSSHIVLLAKGYMNVLERLSVS